MHLYLNKILWMYLYQGHILVHHDVDDLFVVAFSLLPVRRTLSKVK